MYVVQLNRCKLKGIDSMLRKSRRFISKKVDKIQDIYNKSFIYESDLPVELIGENWISNSKSGKGIALLIGFNPWKREVVSHYLDDYKTAFLMGTPTIGKLNRLEKTFINQISDEELTIFIWGKKDKKKIFKRYLSLMKLRKPSLKVCYVEDGFLRSINAGVFHSRPASLCFDFGANHFENKETDLEELLNTVKLTKAEHEEAQRLVSFFIDARLTKYFNPQAFTYKKDFEKLKNVNAEETVLVIGQVETDASIVYGGGEVKTNIELVKKARKENKGKRILFRPHPDIFSKDKKTELDAIKNIAEVLDPSYSLYDSFYLASTVYVISSLSGFEALIHGKKVVVFGTPFYSNWGLTDDRVKIERRTAKLDIATLFKVVYDIYPKYLHPISNTKSSFLEVASYFIVDTLLDKYVSELERDELLLNTLKYQDLLCPAHRVLIYLANTKYPTLAKTDELAKVLGNDFNLIYYPQIAFLLGNTSNYDQLADMANLAITKLDNALSSIDSIDPLLLDNTLHAIYVSHKESHGRTFSKMISLLDYLDESYINGDLLPRIISNYISVLSNNLQYDDIEKLISWIEKNVESFDFKLNQFTSFNKALEVNNDKSINPNIWKKITNILQIPPVRSERDIYRRTLIVDKVANKYLGVLNEQYDSPNDIFINQSLYHNALSNNTQTVSLYRKLLSNLDTSFNNELNGLDMELRSIIRHRLGHFIQIGNSFIKSQYLEEAETIYNHLPNYDDNKSPSIATFKLRFGKAVDGKEGFFREYNKLPKDIASHDSVQQLLAITLREASLYGRALKIYENLYVSSKTQSRKKAMLHEIDTIKFSQETSRIINSVQQPKLPKGVVFLASLKDYYTLAMMAPVIVELKKQGYAFINLCDGVTEFQATGIDFIDELDSLIPFEMHDGKQLYDWHIDWEGRKVQAEGINFYQGFYEWLTRYVRRYFVHPDISPAAMNLFKVQLLRSDSMLRAADKIFQNVVLKGMPVIILSGQPHAPPYSIMREYCMAKNHPLMSFIYSSVAYEAYFSNLGSKLATTMCVTDMTEYPEHRAPFLARKDQFDEWYETNSSNPIFLDKARELINLNRVGSITDDKEIEIISYIKKMKAQGKKVICAFGKVPVDLSVPYDGGPAHRDMSDWITHTVEVCSQCEDVVLLVKPHPHELKPEIALDLVEGLSDLIKTTLGDNVLILGHKDINGHALAPYLDLALLYNGSSGLELAAQGVPVVMASYFGRLDYPVELLYPENRDQYAEFIRSLNYTPPSDETRKKAAFLMCYMGTGEIAIPNEYSIRPVTNDKTGPIKWREDKVRKFLREGDENMSLVARRVTEKVERELAKSKNK